jgi:FkbM family methyltransferase
VTALAASGDIVIDTRSGRVEGASAPERMAIGFLRAANAVLRPFHDFGFSYVARATRKLLPSRKAMVLELADDSRMRVDYCDAYWSTLLAPGYPYEPWITVLLADSADVPYGFIDGGANHGFWSILASGRPGGAKKAIAIEAASDTFRHLEDNRRLNGDRFTALNMAIGAESGQQDTSRAPRSRRLPTPRRSWTARRSRSTTSPRGRNSPASTSSWSSSTSRASRFPPSRARAG